MNIKPLGVPSLVGAGEGLRRELSESARYIDFNAFKEHRDYPVSRRPRSLTILKKIDEIRKVTPSRPSPLTGRRGGE